MVKVQFIWLSDQIIRTDLYFNCIKQFGRKGSSNQQLDYPLGVEYYEDDETF